MKTLGYSRNITLLLTAPPYILCCFTMLLNGIHADKSRERWVISRILSHAVLMLNDRPRFLHIAGPLLITIIANVIAATTTATGPRYLAMMLMPGSFYAASIVILTWISVSLHRSYPAGYRTNRSIIYLAIVESSPRETRSRDRLYQCSLKHGVSFIPAFFRLTAQFSICSPTFGHPIFILIHHDT